jgi:hypothetical protein
MKKTVKQVTRRLIPWIINLSKSCSSDQLVRILALAKVCLLIEDNMNEKLMKSIHLLLGRFPEINFIKNDFINSILACSLVIEFGEQKQIESAVQYKSLLIEISQDTNCELNNPILLAAMIDFECNSKHKLQIQIPQYTNEIDKSIRDTLTKIETETCFGRINVYQDESLIKKIEGMSIYTQQSYNLPLALSCLRVRNYLTYDNSLALRTGIKFIKYQQCTDGSFGDYEGVLSTLNDAAERNDADINIKLTIALEIAWILYELQDKNNNLLTQIWLKPSQVTFKAKKVATC